MNSSKGLLIISTALILCGCASTPQSIGGNYALVSLSSTDTTLNKAIILHVRADSIAGSGPVNRWRAAIDDGEIGPIVSTRRAGPPQLMQYESDLINALEGAKFELDENGILTFNKKRNVTVTFQYVELEPDTSK